MAPRAWTKPRALREGDLVAVVAPSGPVPHAGLVRGLRELERHGLRVRLGASVLARTRYFAGDDDHRLVDLVSLWANPEVKAVFSARGGYGSARIVDALTPSFLRKHPKIFCGYSDLTTIHLACARAGLVSIHGPMVAWDVAAGDAPVRRADGIARPGGYDASSFRAMLFGEGGAAARTLAPREAKTLVPGIARGRLVGGCLTLIAAALGTPEELDTRDSILLLEDVIEPPYRIDRMLTQLRRAGAFDGVKGILLGDFPGCDPKPGADYALVDVLRDRLGDLGIPVAWRAPYGHTARRALTLPLGVGATLEAGRTVRLTVEAPVARGADR